MNDRGQDLADCAQADCLSLRRSGMMLEHDRQSRDWTEAVTDQVYPIHDHLGIHSVAS